MRQCCLPLMRVLAARHCDAFWFHVRLAFRRRQSLSVRVMADVDVPHIRTKSSHKMMSKLGHKVQQYCSFFTVSRNNSCGLGHYGRPDAEPSGEWFSLIMRNFRTKIALLSQVSNVRMALDATLE